MKRTPLLFTSCLRKLTVEEAEKLYFAGRADKKWEELKKRLRKEMKFGDLKSPSMGLRRSPEDVSEFFWLEMLK